MNKVRFSLLGKYFFEMLTCVQKSVPLKLLHDSLINIKFQFLLNRCDFFVVIMTVDFAVGEDMFDDFF